MQTALLPPQRSQHCCSTEIAPASILQDSLSQTHGSCGYRPVQPKQTKECCQTRAWLTCSPGPVPPSPPPPPHTHQPPPPTPSPLGTTHAVQKSVVAPQSTAGPPQQQQAASRPAAARALGHAGAQQRGHLRLATAHHRHACRGNQHQRLGCVSNSPLCECCTLQACIVADQAS